MAKKKIKWQIVITAMICITLLEIVALMKGIDGVLLSAVLVVLAGLAGLSLPQMKLKYS